ncbi:MAG: Gmad2 immunoglobulin-like domain-containing protein [Acidimicrobiales bacterium]
MADQVHAPFEMLDAEPAPAFTADLRRRLAAEMEEAGGPLGGLLPRRPRRWVVVGAAAAVLLAAVAVVTVDDQDQRLEAGPAESSIPAGATTTATALPPVAAVSGPGIWPFTSPAEAAAAPADSPYHDAGFTARAFAREYLGITQDLALSPAPSASGVAVTVTVGHTTGEGGGPWPDAPPITEVLLVRAEPAGPWTVIAARSPRIVPQHEFDQSDFSSPLGLRGEANAYEGTVQVEVREDGMLAGQALGRTFVTGRGARDGSLGAFEGEVTFRRPTRPGGAVVFYETSAADGRILGATVVPARFPER